MMNSTILTLLTIFGSASCAIIGILVNRHISLRQVKTVEAGSVITNAEYWRDESTTLKEQINELEKQIAEAKNREKAKDKEIERQTKETERLTFEWYRTRLDLAAATEELNRHKGISSRSTKEETRMPPNSSNDIS